MVELTRRGYSSPEESHQSGTVAVYKFLIEKPDASNSTVIGLSRVRALMDMRFLIKEGQMSIMFKRSEMLLVGKDMAPV